MPDVLQLELELVRLNLDTALAHLEGSVQMMNDGLRPNLTVPLARQEILKARQKVDLLLSGQHVPTWAGEQEQP